MVPPTATGTSYGLRMISSFDIRAPRISRHQLVGSLLSLQKPGGGWAASTQRDRGRPETTAWVLTALFRAGVDDSVLADLVELLEGMLGLESDPVGMNRTAVLTVVISTLAEIAPASPLLPRLARRLLDGARREAGEPAPLVSWSEHLNGPTGSVAHTARAAVALHRAGSVLADGAVFQDAVRAGVRWLDSVPLDLHSIDEQLRRPVDDGTVDVLVIGHFTAAWVARALMLSGEPMDEEKLRVAVCETLRSHQGGFWRWRDGSRPIWMAYQGAAVLRDYALRKTGCPQQL